MISPMTTTTLSPTAHSVLTALKTQFAGQTTFKRKTLHVTAAQLGYGTSDYSDLIAAPYKVSKGVYNLTTLITGGSATVIQMVASTSSDDEDAALPAKKKKGKEARTWKGEEIISAAAGGVTKSFESNDPEAGFKVWSDHAKAEEAKKDRKKEANTAGGKTKKTTKKTTKKKVD